jgi:hypothetical protein
MTGLPSCGMSRLPRPALQQLAIGPTDLAIMAVADGTVVVEAGRNVLGGRRA